MIKYRIRKETYYGHTTYFPQKGLLGIWWDMCDWSGYTGFGSYDAAKRAIYNYKQRKKVEYLEVDCRSYEE